MKVEEGLINQYISELRSLAVKIECGEDVYKDIDKCVIKICDHFSILKGSDPNDNLKSLKGRLKIILDTYAKPSKMYEALKYTLLKFPESI